MEIATSAPRPHSRGFSFHSERSGGSKGRPEPLVESPRDKDRKSLLWQGGTKANPNAALNEQQPAERTRVEQTTLQNLRDMLHKDVHGEVIADPDLSNPTRSRFERPLDTIRSFEKAINQGYKRRTSYTTQQESADQHDPNNQYASRRSSVFDELGPLHSRRRQSTNALAGLDGPNSSRNALNGGYYGQQRPDPTYSNGGRQRYGQRLNSDPMLYGGAPQQQRQSPSQQGYYSSHDYQPTHDYHQSYDTVHTGGTGGSDSTGPWANSTDPSSEDSSIDRTQYGNKAYMPTDAYNGGNHAPIMEEQDPSQRHSNGYMYGSNGYGSNGSNGYGSNGYGSGNHGSQGHPSSRHNADGYGPTAFGANGHGNNANTSNAYDSHAPPPPAHGSYTRQPIPANGGYNATRPSASSPPEPDKKRKSWLKRRFSKG